MTEIYVSFSLNPIRTIQLTFRLLFLTLTVHVQYNQGITASTHTISAFHCSSIIFTQNKWANCAANELHILSYLSQLIHFLNIHCIKFRSTYKFFPTVRDLPTKGVRPYKQRNKGVIFYASVFRIHMKISCVFFTISRVSYTISRVSYTISRVSYTISRVSYTISRGFYSNSTRR